MESRFATLSITRPKEHVTLVSLNRPAAANAMNTQLGTEIMTLFEMLSLDAEGTRCVVVTAPALISRNVRTWPTKHGCDSI
jgi:enoyl-CoA hydratase